MLQQADAAWALLSVRELQRLMLVYSYWHLT